MTGSLSLILLWELCSCAYYDWVSAAQVRLHFPEQLYARSVCFFAMKIPNPNTFSRCCSHIYLDLIDLLFCKNLLFIWTNNVLYHTVLSALHEPSRWGAALGCCGVPWTRRRVSCRENASIETYQEVHVHCRLDSCSVFLFCAVLILMLLLLCSDFYFVLLFSFSNSYFVLILILFLFCLFFFVLFFYVLIDVLHSDLILFQNNVHSEGWWYYDWWCVYTVILFGLL